MTDFRRLLDALVAGQVEFVIVGGLASTAHGSARLTQDIDIVYSRTPTNLERLIVALAPYPGSNPVQCNGGCPPGFNQVGGLCQKTYDISSSLLDNLSTYCDGTGTNRYNNCGYRSYGFHWTDLGGGLTAVTRVEVQLESGISCGGTSSSVTLNGAPAGSFNPVGSCLCASVHGTVSLPILDVGAYVMGGFNAISILPGVDCEGLSKSVNLDDNFARVTVTYSPHSNACQVGTCDSVVGACVYSSRPDGTTCSDDSVCTSGDACLGGSCLGGDQIVCDDGNLCTSDSCDPVLGCVYTNNAIACDDGNACTYGDTCSGGSCAGTAVPAPSEASGVTVGKSDSDATIAWTLAAYATTSDVLRGEMASLPVGSGGGEVCLGNTAATTTTDAYIPAANSGVWYLIRGVNACAGNGPYGFQGVHGVPGAPRVSTSCP